MSKEAAVPQPKVPLDSYFDVMEYGVSSHDSEPSLEWSKTLLEYGPFAGRTYIDVANAADWGYSDCLTPTSPRKSVIEKAEKVWCRDQIQIESNHSQRQSFLKFLRYVADEQSCAINDFVTDMRSDKDSAHLQYMEEHDGNHALLIYNENTASLKTAPESPVQVLQRVVVSELASTVHCLTGKMLKGEECASQMLTAIDAISCMCATIGVSLVQIFEWKMRLNAMKYPVGKTAESVTSVRSIPKYTELAHITNYKGDDVNPLCFPATHGVLLTHGYIRQEIADKEQYLHSLLYAFAEQRGWLAQYSVSGLALSLWAEFGEICSALEYCKSGEVETTLKMSIAREIADLTIYLFHFARLKGITMKGLLNYKNS